MYPQSVLSKNKKNITYFASENYRFYSRQSHEKLQYIVWACFRNEYPKVEGQVSPYIIPISSIVPLIILLHEALLQNMFYF